ncbi:MAG: hypothetical protein JSW50_02485 [Candidatus Latescibacterota bacterium]|nr:MAG: hypothetical protein JSW50_02485 [Candidatus Latescibacterota bacterium]
MPGTRRLILLVSGLLSFVVLAAAPCLAVGPYLDAARMSAFIRAPHDPAVIGMITHSEADDHGASYYWLGGDFPVRTKFLLQLEVPYIDLAFDDELRDGFGDARLRAKARAWTWSGGAVYLLGGILFGSGSADLFPYSTQSTDWEIGAAVVDTLGVRDERGHPQPLSSVSLWASVSAVYVTRLSDRIKTNDLHGNYASLGFGAIYPLSLRFEVEAGGLMLGFRNGGTRMIFYGQLAFHYSTSTQLFATLQAEAGRREDRASDYSAAIGMGIGL